MRETKIRDVLYVKYILLSFGIKMYTRHVIARCGIIKNIVKRRATVVFTFQRRARDDKESLYIHERNTQASAPSSSSPKREEALPI